MYKRGNEDSSIKGRSRVKVGNGKGRADVKDGSLQCWEKILENQNNSKANYN